MSKLLVRQAVHRLADVGLVEARQGAKTRILDPQRSTDLRLLDLYYRLAPETSFAKDLREDVLEKQYTQGLSLLDVFLRKASPRAAKELVSLFQEDGLLADEALFTAAEERFWTRVAELGGNRILLFEVRFWYRALARRPASPAPVGARHAFYVELSRRLVSNDAALEYYRDTLRPRRAR